jgi:PadR family transcriptional regulator PadR
MRNTRTNPDFLNGVPELLVLHLVSQVPMHGYQLVQAIKEATGQRLEFGEGCIYPVLHRLQAQQELASQREQAGGRSRVVYRVTPKGRKRLAETLSNWQGIVAAVQQALQGGAHANPELA